MGMQNLGYVSESIEATVYIYRVHAWQHVNAVVAAFCALPLLPQRLCWAPALPLAPPPLRPGARLMRVLPPLVYRTACMLLC